MAPGPPSSHSPSLANSGPAPRQVLGQGGGVLGGGGGGGDGGSGAEGGDGEDGDDDGGGGGGGGGGGSGAEGGVARVASPGHSHPEQSQFAATRSAQLSCMVSHSESQVQPNWWCAKLHPPSAREVSAASSHTKRIVATCPTYFRYISCNRIESPGTRLQEVADGYKERFVVASV